MKEKEEKADIFFNRKEGKEYLMEKMPEEDLLSAINITNKRISVHKDKLYKLKVVKKQLVKHLRNNACVRATTVEELKRSRYFIFNSEFLSYDLLTTNEKEHVRKLIEDENERFYIPA